MTLQYVRLCKLIEEGGKEETSSVGPGTKKKSLCCTNNAVDFFVLNQWRAIFLLSNILIQSRREY
jgi:hypothetical protein